MEASSDNLHYPGTSVLRNRLGISCVDQLKVQERRLVTVRSVQLVQGLVVLPGRFDFERLKATHRQLFQDIYDWAGQPRGYDIRKGSSLFVVADELDETAAAMFAELRSADDLRGLSDADFAEAVAHFYSHLNYLHPFPEGNGRTQRQFVADLAAAAGHPLEWPADTDRQYTVTIAAFDGRTRPLIEYFREAVAAGTDIPDL